MFYSFELLSLKKKGKFCIPWALATTRKVISKRDVAKFNIREACKDIREMIMTSDQRKERRFSLYVSSVLMHGLCIIFSQKVDMFYESLISARRSMIGVGMDNDGNICPLLYTSPPKRRTIDGEGPGRPKKPRKDRPMTPEATVGVAAVQPEPPLPATDEHLLLDAVPLPRPVEGQGFGELTDDLMEVILGQLPLEDALRAGDLLREGLMDAQPTPAPALEAETPMDMEEAQVEPDARVLEDPLAAPEHPQRDVEGTSFDLPTVSLPSEPTVSTGEPHTLPAETAAARPEAVAGTSQRVPSPAQVESPVRRRIRLKRIYDEQIEIVRARVRCWIHTRPKNNRYAEDWQDDMDPIVHSGRRLPIEQLLRLPSIPTLNPNLELNFERFVRPLHVQELRHSQLSATTSSTDSLRGRALQHLQSVQEVPSLTESGPLSPLRPAIEEGLHKDQEPLLSGTSPVSVPPIPEVAEPPAVLETGDTLATAAVQETSETAMEVDDMPTERPGDATEMADPREAVDADLAIREEPPEVQHLAPEQEAKEISPSKYVEGDDAAFVSGHESGEGPVQPGPNREMVLSVVSYLLEDEPYIYFTALCPPGQCSRVEAALTFRWLLGMKWY